MSLEDVLDWLGRRLLCGTLTVEHGPSVRTFIIDAGYVTNASSNEPRDELGLVLVSAGLVDRNALDEARQVQADTGVPLGRILTMVGKLDETRLRALLEEQARETVLDVFTWDEGTFAFERSDEAPKVSEIAIAVQIGGCLEDGRLRAARWEQIHARIPSTAVVPGVVNASELAAHNDGDRAVSALARAAEQGLAIERVLAEAGMARFRLLDRLLTLIDEGVLSLLGTDRVAANTPVEALAEQARRLAEAGDRTGAFELARHALSRQPEDEALQTLAQSAERALFAELSRELLTSFRVPRLLVQPDQLAGLDLSPGELALAQRVDGRWDLLSLLRASPMREAEALITFKRLADRGVIML